MAEPSKTALTILLEFARVDQAGDAYAFPTRPTKYTLRQTSGGYVEGVLRWNEQLLRRLTALRTRAASPDDRQVLGRTLRTFLGGFGWDQTEARVEAALADGRPVVITVRSAAAELFRLPWPLLTRGESDQHLGAHPQVLFRSEWPAIRTEPAVPTHGPQRVLVAWSAATRPVPWGQHVDAIAQACEAGAVPFDRDQDVLGNATPKSLLQRLQAARPERPIGVLHLLCHGAAVGDVFGLGLDGDDGSPVAVDAAAFRDLLSPFSDRVRLVVVSACDAANDGPWDATLGSVALALHKAGFAAVVAPRYPLSGAGSVTLTQTLYRTLFEGPGSLEDAVRATQRALATAHPDDIEWLSLQLFARDADGVDSRPVTFRPYRGLLAFQAEQVRFFFGRDAERAEILADLDRLHEAGRPRLLVVAGASGTGKSSLVLAGVTTDLRARDRAAGRGPTALGPLAQVLEQLRTLLPGIDDPDLRERARKLVQGAPIRDGVAGGWQVAVTKPGQHPLRSLEATLDAHEGQPGALFLVVDQFEELFTQGTEPAEREAYARRLWAESHNPRRRIDVVITVRVDYLGHCGQITLDADGVRLDKVAYDDRHRVFVPQLDLESLRQAIELPAARVGLGLEPGLTERMLGDVAGEPGALPLLQYTLDMLWQQRQGALLTQEAYEALGGVTGALHRRADTIIDGLTPAQQVQARRLLVQLVTVSEDGARDTRRRVVVARIRPEPDAEAEAFDQARQALVAARLLVGGQDGDDATVEVAHEALIHRWARLQAWLDEDQDMLRQLAELRQWAAQADEYGTLLTGAQLGYAQQVLSKYASQIDQATRRLILESAEHAARVAGRQRRISLLLVAAASAVALLMWVKVNDARSARGEAQWSAWRAELQKIVALQEKARAVGATQDAEAARLRAEAAGRSTQMAFVTNLAGRMTEDRLLAATLLQRTAPRPGDRTKRRHRRQWVRAAADLLTHPVPLTRLHLLKDPQAAEPQAGALVSVSPDGRYAAVVAKAGSVVVWPLEGRGAPPWTFTDLRVPNAPQPLEGVGWAPPDGKRPLRRAVVSAPKPAVRAGPSPRATKPPAPRPQSPLDAWKSSLPARAAADPGAASTATGSRLWHGRLCGWSPGGDALLLCGDGVHVLPLTPGAEPVRAEGARLRTLHHNGRRSAATFCKSKDRSASAAWHAQDDGPRVAKGFAIWSGVKAERFVPLPGVLEALRCSPDGQTVAAEYVESDTGRRRVRLWVAAQPWRSIELVGEASQVEFSPDGAWLAGLVKGQPWRWPMDLAELKRDKRGWGLFKGTSIKSTETPLSGPLAWSHDGQLIAAGRVDGQLQVMWGFERWRPYVHPAAGVVQLAWTSPAAGCTGDACGPRVVSRDARGQVTLREPKRVDKAPRLITRNSEGGMVLAQPRPGAEGGLPHGVLITIDAKARADVWSLDPQRLRSPGRFTLDDPLKQIWLRPQGGHRLLWSLSGRGGQSLRRWNLSRPGPPRALPLRDTLRQIAISRDGQVAVTVLPEAVELHRVPLAADDPKQLKRVRWAGIRRAGTSPTGDRVALIDDDCRVRFLTADAKRLSGRHRRAAEGCDVSRISFSPSGERFVTPNRVVDTPDGLRFQTLVWSLDRRARAPQPIETRRPVEAVAWASGNDTVALVGRTFALTVSASGEVAAMAAPKRLELVGSDPVALSPRGERLAVLGDHQVTVLGGASPVRISGTSRALAWSSDNTPKLASVRAGDDEACPYVVEIHSEADDNGRGACFRQPPEALRFVGERVLTARPAPRRIGERILQLCELEAVPRLDRCARLEGFAPPGPVPLIQTPDVTLTLTVVGGRTVRTWPLDRSYGMGALEEQLKQKSSYCPPAATLRRLLPLSKDEVHRMVRECHAEAGRGDAEGPAAEPAEPKARAQSKRSYLASLANRIRLVEAHVANLPLRSRAYGRRQALLGRLLADYARLQGDPRGAGPKKPRAKAELRATVSLRARAIAAYHEAVKWGPRGDRLGWYLALVATAAAMHGGDRTHTEVLKAACDRDLLLDDHPMGRVPAFDRVQRCALLRTDAAEAAEHAEDPARAAAFYAAAAGTYPPGEALSASQRRVRAHQVEALRARAEALRARP